MLAILSKEFMSFFTSMLGYAFVALYLLVVGIYFFVFNLSMGYTNYEYVLSSIVFLFIIIIPILTMKTFSDENRNKTDQMLLTAPVTVEKIVLGKFLGVLSVLGTAIGFTLFYPIIIFVKSATSDLDNVNLLQTYYAVFGYFLLAAAFISIGIFVSSLTESSSVSAVVTFVIVLLSYLMTSLTSMIPNDNRTTWLTISALIIAFAFILYWMMKNMVISIVVGAIGEIIAAILYFTVPSVYDNVLSTLLECVSLVTPLSNFLNGIVELSNIVYYLSIIGIFLFLTSQVIKKKRWS